MRDVPERKVIHEETTVDNRREPVVVQPGPVATTGAPVVNESRTVDVYDNPVERKLHNLEQISRLIYFVFGVLEILLLFRFVLKLLAANPDSGFGSFIYNVTWPFVAPFAGVLGQPMVPQTGSVIEFPTLLAIAVYALLSWGIVKLLWIIGNPGPVDHTVTTSVDRHQRF